MRKPQQPDLGLQQPDWQSTFLPFLNKRGLLADVSVCSKSPCQSCPYPPAIAPTISNGSFPEITASGKGASIDSCERSSSHAKKRKNGRRCCVTWSRMVPRSIGQLASIASTTERCVTAPLISTCTSPLTCANPFRCGGSKTRIMAASGPPRKAPPADPAQSAPSYPPRRPKRTPAHRSFRNTRRIYRVSPPPSHPATRSRSSPFAANLSSTPPTHFRPSGYDKRAASHPERNARSHS